MSLTADNPQPALVGVGYAGRTVAELVEQLVAMGVSRPVDVRLTPISREPGLSKTALGHALSVAGCPRRHRKATSFQRYAVLVSAQLELADIAPAPGRVSGIPAERGASS